MLQLKPWELDELTPLEFEKMVKGYELKSRIEDSRKAFFVTLITNVQLRKQDHIKVKDIMKQLHPPTKYERRKEEIEFLREWEAQGGGEI